MGPVERSARYHADLLREAARRAEATGQPMAGWLPRRGAADLDFWADLLAIEGLDLSDLYRPSAGDALALRGEA